MQAMGKNAIRLCITAAWVGLCVLSCTHSHKPNDTVPALVNDTGVNVMVSFDPNGGYWDVPGKKEVKNIIGNTGTPLHFTDTPQQDDLVFNGWNHEGGIPKAFPARKAVYKAQWRAYRTDETFYTVKHELENLEDNNYTVKESERRYGRVGTAPDARPKDYPGFDYHKEGSVIPLTITENGATTLTLKYLRKRVTLTFHLDGGTTATQLTGGQSLTGKCGAPLTVSVPKKNGSIFNGWNTIGGTLPKTFPDKPAVYKALWRDAGTSPSPQPQPNLVQNADFSKTKTETGKFKAYWGSNQSPASWNTWASEETTSGTTFKVENSTFSITAGTTKLKNAGIQQPITLPDTTVRTRYSLSLHIDFQNITLSPNPSGVGLVKLNGKELFKEGGGKHDIKCIISLEENNTFTFRYNTTTSQKIPLENGKKIKLELFGNGLISKSVSFSNITLTKE